MKPASTVPRTTHQWLKPLYDYIDNGVVRAFVATGATTPNAVWYGSQTPLSKVGTASGLLGLFGASGVAPQLSTGTNGITAWTGAGASAGLLWFNGGSGAFYTIGDIVATMKNIGLLKP